jgi:hypothetical protein
MVNLAQLWELGFAEIGTPASKRKRPRSTCYEQLRMDLRWPSTKCQMDLVLALCRARIPCGAMFPDCQSFVALQDINAGEELLDNLVFGGGEDFASFNNNLQELNHM